MYIGLTREQAVSCFDFGTAPDSRLEPQIIEKAEGMVLESLVSTNHTDCFIVNRVKLSGDSFTPNVADSYAVYIVVEGSGEISGDGYNKPIKKGDYFFMPSCAMGKFTIKGNAEIIECY